MSTDWNAVFGNLRGSPFDPSNDPNAIPQEIGARGGNVAPHGWLADGSVTVDTISANAVTTDKLAANAVTAAKIAANSITANEIAAGAIDTSELAANAVTAAKIQANTITASEIAADAITANELAANSVQTVHIVAANVTSGKIELTISGKNFGANSGSSSAPGVYFDSASDVGLYYLSSGPAVFLSSGQGATDPIVSVDKGAGKTIIWRSHLTPSADNSKTCGTSVARWSAVWAANGTIQTSDKRDKKDIADVPLGLDFIRQLRPRVFRWRDTPDTQAEQEAKVDKRALSTASRLHEREIRKVRDLQLAGKLSDADAEARVRQLRSAFSMKADELLAPAMNVRHERRPGRRLHYGLIAQEVKKVLDQQGVDSMDAGFWVKDEQGRQGLNYSQLIAPLMRAVQELADKVDRLEGSGTIGSSES